MFDRVKLLVLEEHDASKPGHAQEAQACPQQSKRRRLGDDRIAAQIGDGKGYVVVEGDGRAKRGEVGG